MPTSGTECSRIDGVNKNSAKTKPSEMDQSTIQRKGVARKAYNRDMGRLLESLLKAENEKMGAKFVLLEIFWRRKKKAIFFVDIRGRDASHWSPGDAAVAWAQRQARWSFAWRFLDQR